MIAEGNFYSTGSVDNPTNGRALVLRWLAMHGKEG